METLVRERVGAAGDSFMSKEKKFERALERDRVKLQILDEAAVVCSTLSFSGRGLHSSTISAQRKHFLSSSVSLSVTETAQVELKSGRV